MSVHLPTDSQVAAVIENNTAFAFEVLRKVVNHSFVCCQCFYSLQTFAKRLFNLCGINSSAISLPLKVSCLMVHVFACSSCMLTLCESYCSQTIQIHQPPVYGKMGLSFTDFMGPGIITAYVHTLWISLQLWYEVHLLCLLSLPRSSTALGISIGLTAVVLIQERKEGLIDRTWVAGVNVTEVIISQVITQFFILLVQILLMLVFVLFVFKVNAWGYRHCANTPMCLQYIIIGFSLRSTTDQLLPFLCWYFLHSCRD